MKQLILGFLLGKLSNNEYLQTLGMGVERKYKRKSSYVPKFSGYFYDDGSRIDENCIWIEPEYKKRYVNILEKDNRIIFRIDLNINPDATDYEECENHRYAEIYIDGFKEFYSSMGYNVEVNLDNVCFINVFNVDNEIVLNVSRYKKADTKESLGCLIGIECNELLMNMQVHYELYRSVSIQNEMLDLLE